MQESQQEEIRGHEGFIPNSVESEIGQKQNRASVEDTWDPIGHQHGEHEEPDSGKGLGVGVQDTFVDVVFDGFVYQTGIGFVFVSMVVVVVTVMMLVIAVMLGMAIVLVCVATGKRIRLV